MAATLCCRWADDTGAVSDGTFDFAVDHFDLPQELELVLLAQLYALGATVTSAATRVLFLEPLPPGLSRMYAHPLLGESGERTLVAHVAEGHAAASKLEGDDGLTGFDKRRLAEIVARGEHAKRELVEHNIRLVAQQARRLRRRAQPFLEVDELVSEGIAGLMHAIDKFDITRGFRLSTYATWWIRQSMHRAIANQVSHIRIPVHAQEDMQAITILERDRPIGSDRLSDSEVACALDLPLSTVATLRQAMEPVESYEFQIAQAAVDAATDDDTDLVLDRSVVEGALHELERRDPIAHRVVLERFGFATGDGQTLQQVGERMELTRERIRQIQNRALDELRVILQVPPRPVESDAPDSGVSRPEAEPGVHQ